MKLAMNSTRYTLTAVLIHWLQAALVLGLLGLGFYMTGLPKGPDKTAWYGLHKSFGLIALALICIRCLWRWRHRAPPLAEDWRGRLAGGVHRLLYLLLFVVPLAGYLSASHTPYPMKFFGTPILKLGRPDEALNALFNSLHQASTLLLAGLVGLHVLGALYHASLGGLSPSATGERVPLGSLHS